MRRAGRSDSVAWRTIGVVGVGGGDGILRCGCLCLGCVMNGL